MKSLIILLLSFIITTLAFFMKFTGNDRGTDFLRHFGFNNKRYNSEAKKKGLLEAIDSVAAFVVGVFLLWLTLSSVIEFFEKNLFAKPDISFCETISKDSDLSSLDDDNLKKISKECGGKSEIVAEADSLLRRRAENMKQIAEQEIYKATLSCFEKSSLQEACRAIELDRCVIIYEASSKSKDHLDDLTTRVRSERESTRCKVPAPQAISFCLLQSSFDVALSAGAAGLQAFIKKCAAEGGPLVANAVKALSSMPLPQSPHKNAIYVKATGRADLAPLMERVVKADLRNLGYIVAAEEAEASYSLIVGVENEPSLAAVGTDYTGRLVWEARSRVNFMIRANATNRIITSKEIIGTATSNDPEDVYLRENARLSSKEKILQLTRSSISK
jgi:hypothetical protein